MGDEMKQNKMTRRDKRICYLAKTKILGPHRKGEHRQTR